MQAMDQLELDSDDEESERDELWPELRDTPFDLHKVLRIPCNMEGGFSGGASRVRAAYHAAILRHPPPLALQYPLNKPRPECSQCNQWLHMGRNWWHRAPTGHKIASVTGAEGAPGAEHKDDDEDEAVEEWESVRFAEDLCERHAAELEHESKAKFVEVHREADLGSLSTHYRECLELREVHVQYVLKFHQIALAYMVLKDAERCEIYRNHGYATLIQSESYAEESVFDVDPYEAYNAFFRGDNEDDRQYLLLSGNQWPSDDEDGTSGSHNNNDEDEDEEEEEEEEGAASLAEAARLQRGSGHTRFGTELVETDPLPMPPVSVLGSLSGGDHLMRARSLSQSTDVWQQIHKNLSSDNDQAASTSWNDTSASCGNAKSGASCMNVIKPTCRVKSDSRAARGGRKRKHNRVIAGMMNAYMSQPQFRTRPFSSFSAALIEVKRGVYKEVRVKQKLAQCRQPTGGA